MPCKLFLSLSVLSPALVPFCNASVSISTSETYVHVETSNGVVKSNRLTNELPGLSFFPLCAVNIFFPSSLNLNAIIDFVVALSPATEPS